MIKPSLFTCESVSCGHPDKIADQISDAVLDAILIQDKHARVACETLVKSGMVLVAGEITTSAWVDIESIARGVIFDCGYNDPQLGFDSASCAVLTAIGKQSLDIAQGVDRADHSLGAGDQGTMFGYACSDNDSYLPAPLHDAHRLMQQQERVRCNGQAPLLRPDAKAQVTYRYQNGKPTTIDCMVISTQHDPSLSHAQVKEQVMELIIKPTIPAKCINDQTRFLINPTGRFVIGGPVGDCGLTGRKIIVDTYGGAAPHGGGCFSGKDPSKVDRSGAYMARYIAKNLVHAQLASECLIQIAYAIGITKPVAVYINTFGTSAHSDQQLLQAIESCFDLRPAGIIDTLDLLQPIYKKTACYGHFGRESKLFPWERTDQCEALIQAVK